MTIYKVAGALKGEKGDPGPAGPGGGIDQAQADATVRRLVADPAEQGNSSAWPTSKIPNLNASKTNAGTFDQARIPGLPASRVTSGAFATTRIPNLDAAKIASGRFDAARLPTNSAFIRDISQSAYDALSTADKNNGTIYNITS